MHGYTTILSIALPLLLLDLALQYIKFHIFAIVCELILLQILLFRVSEKISYQAGFQTHP